jgi:c-di-GMP-binding flagellar brake protein YcgR
MKKVFISSTHQAPFLCEACGKQVVKDVSRFAALDHKIHLKWTCACGHPNSVMLERRRFVRKNVNLAGTYSFETQDGRSPCTAVTLLDISQRGLRFRQAQGRRPPPLRIGQRLSMRFNLDDESQTAISREVTVRKINGDIVGAQFNTDQHYDKLGPYLLFHDA